MATEFDSQLIESVAVRRNRMTDALLYGNNPTERRWKATAKQFLFSVVAAALIAAICVAVSFVSGLLADQQRQRAEQEQQVNSSPAIRNDDGAWASWAQGAPHAAPAAQRNGV